MPILMRKPFTAGYICLGLSKSLKTDMQWNGFPGLMWAAGS